MLSLLGHNHRASRKRLPNPGRGPREWHKISHGFSGLQPIDTLALANPLQQCRFGASLCAHPGGLHPVPCPLLQLFKHGCPFFWIYL